MTIPSCDIADVLESPVWTVLATVLAAATIAVTVLLYRRQRSRKRLACEIRVTPLVGSHRIADDKLKTYFEDGQSERVHLVEARVENTGNVPVTANDFERPISFHLGDSATVLAVDVSSKSPLELPEEVTLRGGEVRLMPLLLNPGDGLTLKILVGNLRDEVQCQYRIIGISRMVDVSARAKRKEQRTLSR